MMTASPVRIRPVRLSAMHAERRDGADGTIYVRSLDPLGGPMTEPGARSVMATSETASGPSHRPCSTPGCRPNGRSRS